MSHRFSNPKRTRVQMLARAAAEQARFQSWEDVPQELRVLILEDIQSCIEEVLNGA